MYKTIVVYTHPAEADRANFENHYFNVHIPLVQKIPGLVKAEVNRVDPQPDGSPAPYFLITELCFNNEEEMAAAMATPEGKAVLKDTRNFPPGLMTVVRAQVEE
jgi:uncharacterized protein (TIGR02118 family)